MKVLITGAGGQLGKELIQLFTMWGYKVCSYSRNQLDITNYIEVKKILKRDQPDILINTSIFVFSLPPPML